MIVIDASALVKFLLKEDGWDEVAGHLRAGTLSADHVVKEAANAVWKRSRQGAISLEEARIMLQALKEILDKAVTVEGELPYMDEAVKIAFNRDTTIYDSLYLAIAKRKGLQLLTADESQANAATAEDLATILLK